MSAAELAVSSWSWHDRYYAGTWSLLDLPAAAAALGLHYLECNDFMLPPPRWSRVRRLLCQALPGAPPEWWRYSRASLRRLRDRAITRATPILAWTINSDFAVPARHWPLQRLYLRRGLLAARLLGARLLRVNLGGSPATSTAQGATVVHRLARFAGAAQQYYPGLALTVENHWGISSDPDRHLALFDRARQQLSPSLQARFGCCFDPGNVPAGAPAAQRERWWWALAARANHYHFKTTAFNAAGEDVALPHAFLLALLREAGYRGAYTVEFQGDGDAAAGVRQSAALFRVCCDGSGAC